MLRCGRAAHVIKGVRDRAISLLNQLVQPMVPFVRRGAGIANDRRAVVEDPRAVSVER